MYSISVMTFHHAIFIYDPRLDLRIFFFLIVLLGDNFDAFKSALAAIMCWNFEKFSDSEITIFLSS